MGFWERATGLGGEPLDLGFFHMVLVLHAGDVVDESVFGAPQLNLDAGELVELGQLLAEMPEEQRGAWLLRVQAVFQGARFLEQLDTVAKVKTALGVAP